MFSRCPDGVLALFLALGIPVIAIWIVYQAANLSSKLTEKSEKEFSQIAPKAPPLMSYVIFIGGIIAACYIILLGQTWLTNCVK
jgi:hypothetical protein